MSKNKAILAFDSQSVSESSVIQLSKNSFLESDQELALILGLRPEDISTLEVLKWENFTLDPWMIRGTEGDELCKLENIEVSLIKAKLNRQPFFELKSILKFDKTSSGWETFLRRERDVIISSLEVTLTFTSLLETSKNFFGISCADNQRIDTSEVRYATDFFDAARTSGVRLNPTGGEFWRCN